MADLVLTEVDSGGVATVTLNRPEARNPTSIAMLDAMDQAFDAIMRTDAVRVVILRGAPPSFSSGLDLDEVTSDEATIRTLLGRLSAVMRRFGRLPMPTIAEVEGAAIGGGFGLMAAADFAVTHPEAKLGYPPLETGLSGALMAPWLVRKIAPARARVMLLAGGTITGRAAREIGIASHLVERETLHAETRRLAGELCAGPPRAARAMKAFLAEIDGPLGNDVLDLAAKVSIDVIASAETQERLRKLFGGGHAR